jgi:large subunit ribosomal protein L4
MKEILTNLKVERNVMLLIDELDENIVLAARNLHNVLLLTADEINTMDVISANKIIATEAAIKSVEEALS